MKPCKTPAKCLTQTITMAMKGLSNASHANEAPLTLKSTQKINAKPATRRTRRFKKVKTFQHTTTMGRCKSTTTPWQTQKATD
jgi:hypothetical protein